MQRYYVQVRSMGCPFVFDIVGRQHFSPTLSALFRNSDEAYTRKLSTQETTDTAMYLPLKSRRHLCNAPLILRKPVRIDETRLEVKDFAEVIQLCADAGYMPQGFAEHQLAVWERGTVYNRWPDTQNNQCSRFSGASRMTTESFISQLGG